MDRGGFGKPVEKCTDEELLNQIKYHEEQITNGQVGTSNVYVRLGDLKREYERRCKTRPVCGHVICDPTKCHDAKLRVALSTRGDN